MREERHTGNIEVVDESGARLQIDVFTTFTRFGPVGNAATWSAGGKRYELDGEHCNAVDGNTFRTLDTNRMLRRV